MSNERQKAIFNAQMVELLKGATVDQLVEALLTKDTKAINRAFNARGLVLRNVFESTT